MPKIVALFVFAACCTMIGSAQNSSGSPSQVQNPQTVRVSAAVMQRIVDNRALPQYPKQALTKGIQGDVVFDIVVDETGKIVQHQAVQGDPLLITASDQALRDYRFRPYLLNGIPVRVESQLGYHFTLSRHGDTTEGQVECMTSVP